MLNRNHNADPPNPNPGQALLDAVGREPPRPCILCSGPPRSFGFFFPNEANQSRFDGIGRVGKLHVVGYWLCVTCQERSDVKDRIEDVIFSDLERMQGEPKPEPRRPGNASRRQQEARRSAFLGRWWKRRRN